MYFRYVPLKFQCTGCGACCTGAPGDVVEVTEAEIAAICALLSLDRAQFARKYMQRRQDDSVSLKLDANGRCVFLAQDNSCGIYAARPRQCISYPFWPEIVATKSAWQREATRCEGIGRGEPVAREHIVRWIKDEG